MECKKRLLRLKTIQLFATYVGFILYLACFSTPAWIVYSDGIVKRTSGLFQICLDNGQNDCSALEAKDNILRTVQPLGCLGLVAYFCFCVSASLAHFCSDKWKMLKGIKFLAFISALSAGTFVAIAHLLILQSKVENNSSLGYSGIIGVISVFFALILCPFYILDGMKAKDLTIKKKPFSPNIPPQSYQHEDTFAWSDGMKSNDRNMKNKPFSANNPPLSYRHEDSFACSDTTKFCEHVRHGEPREPSVSGIIEEESSNPPRLLPYKPTLTLKEPTLIDLELEADDAIVELENDETLEEINLKPSRTLVPLKPATSLYFNNEGFTPDFDDDFYELLPVDSDRYLQPVTPLPEHLLETPPTPVLPYMQETVMEEKELKSPDHTCLTREPVTSDQDTTEIKAQSTSVSPSIHNCESFKDDETCSSGRSACSTPISITSDKHDQSVYESEDDSSTTSEENDEKGEITGVMDQGINEFKNEQGDGSLTTGKSVHFEDKEDEDDDMSSDKQQPPRTALPVPTLNCMQLYRDENSDTDDF
ncbi:Hypothetical predicted protein [Mytilus galloprovincialis]|uniref:Uncharacterized protein n=1 Tax=Mytilus galloprovincialis TaxID=29158 RepID=A0A8B6CAZ9_MYTGA|nr:Hypothetical predicted protein [Mytilus galloprovincialis]